MDGATFTVHGLVAGACRSLPLALGVDAYGFVFGVLARQTGLSLAELLLMSGLVYAGSAQFVALGMWATPLPVLSLVLTTLLVNLRLVLMGAALGRWLSQLPAPKAYGALFFLADENWALALGEYARGGRDAAFLLGSGLLLWCAWLGTSAAGYIGGGAVRDPARWGLDFAFTAVFAALLVGLWKGRADLVPWAVSAGVAVGANRWLPGAWHILLGGLAGSVVGAMRDGR